MRAHFPGRFFFAVAMCGVLVAAALIAGVHAQTKGAPERYNATAINMGSGPAAAGRVLIAVNRWTTAKEREALLGVFVEKGPDQLLETLQRNPSTGTIRLPNTLAWDLRYAFESPLPEGGRRVVLATDRPISFREARNQPRTTDYPFTLIEIRFDKNGVGVGKMSVATKITLSKDKQTMELENYGIEPVRLTEVRIEK
jgi:hypothetical protein